MRPSASGTPGGNVARHALELAHVALQLAREAEELALRHSGPGHDAHVAQTAANLVAEASQTLARRASAGCTAEEAIQTATWALTAAAVALTQAKLNAPPPANGQGRKDATWPPS